MGIAASMMVVVVVLLLFAVGVSASQPPDLTLGGLNVPHGIAIDGTTRTLFVADTDNNRILIYHNCDSLTPTSTPDAVLGQPNLTTTSILNPPSAASLSSPYRLTVDPGDM